MSANLNFLSNKQKFIYDVFATRASPLYPPLLKILFVYTGHFLDPGSGIDADPQHWVPIETGTYRTVPVPLIFVAGSRAGIV